MARGKDQSDFERGFIVGTQMVGSTVTKTAQLARVSIGTVTKVTSAFRSMGKTSVRYVRKNRGAALPQVTENVNCQRTVCPQLHREGYYSRVVSSRMTMPPSTGYEGSLNGLMSMEMM